MNEEEIKKALSLFYDAARNQIASRLTKREQFALAAMQGMTHNLVEFLVDKSQIELEAVAQMMVEASFQIADGMIAESDKVQS